MLHDSPNSLEYQYSIHISPFHLHFNFQDAITPQNGKTVRVVILTLIINSRVWNVWVAGKLYDPIMYACLAEFRLQLCRLIYEQVNSVQFDIMYDNSEWSN